MRHNKIIVVGSIFFYLIFIFALWYFIHNFAQQKILQLDLERQKLVHIRDNILNYKNKYGNLDDYMQTIEKDYQLSNVSIPEQMRQGEFVNFLQQTASENNVNIISIISSTIQIIDENSKVTANLESVDDNANASINKFIQDKKLSKLIINVKIESGYFQLINFLKMIESSERLVNIENLSLISKGDGDDLNCELKLSIFSLER